MKRVHIFWEKLLGRQGFSPKSAPSSGKSRFSVFDPGPEFSLRARGPKRAEIPVNHPLRPPGGPTEKKLLTEKVAENDPGWLGNTFFRFLGPFCSADQKEPYGAGFLLVASFLAC